MLRLLFFFGFLLIMSGCHSVRPYQRVYLNDEDMLLKPRPVEFNETNAAAYREGAAGAIGGKSGGGCGCN